MKLMHLSDLHLGKRLNEFSMIEDQRYILNQILHIADSEKTDGVIIAGDIYDKTVPSAEALQLFDDFLVGLVQKKQKIFVISGNHDSGERIAFAFRLLNASHVYMSPVYNGQIHPICCEDEYGTLNIYLLPFVKPANVRRFFENEPIESYTDMIYAIIRKMQIDCTKRNILVMHQNMIGSVRCESEEIYIGGLDGVDCAALKDFDYTALGHIHNPQNISGLQTVRYCGSPLKYSFSEVNRQKSATILDIREKGNISFQYIPLVPMRDLYEIRGTYNEITSRTYYENKPFKNGYLHITLTDEQDIPEALGKLRTVYPYLMKLDYDNARTHCNHAITGAVHAQNKSVQELFAELYELQNNMPMTIAQQDYINALINKMM